MDLLRRIESARASVGTAARLAVAGIDAERLDAALRDLMTRMALAGK